MMRQVEREAAYERVRGALGVDRIGTGSDAPPLPPRRGRASRRGASLPIEAEVYAAVKQYEYGEVWGRSGLDLRTRSFISIAVVAAMGHEDELYRQINSGLNLGITPEQIHEALIQVSVYGGISAWQQAVAVADEVFVVRGILPEGDGVTVELKAPMDHDDRKAAAERVMSALGAGRLGTSADAPILAPLPGSAGIRSDDLPLGQEIAWINGYYGYGEVWGRTGLELR